MKSLDEQIEHTEKLHTLRHRARTLHNVAIKVLGEREYDRINVGWQPPGDDIEKAMILHALRGQGSEGKRKKLIDELGKRALLDWDSFDQRTAHTTSDHVSILRAALLMQSYVEIPKYALSERALFCFHRVIRELYHAGPPAWSAGAARAGERAAASAFATNECTRAILSLEHSLQQTAAVAELLAEAAVRKSKLFPNATFWSRQEDLFRSESVRVSLDLLLPCLVVELPKPASDPSLGLTELVKAFESVSKYTVKKPVSAADSSDAWAVADKAVKDILDAVNHISLIKEKDIETSPSDAGEQIARTLKGAAQKVRALVEPAARFASSVIDRQLAASSPHLARQVDAAELVFASTVVGRLSGWDHPKVRSGAQLVITLLNADGRLLSLRPFDVISKGYRLHVATLEVTRRVAELLANVDVDPEPDFVERLMRPFEDTRAFSQDGLEPGWATDPPSPTRLSEWWVTALAADALESVVHMLDESINRQLLRHFSVRRPSELKLGLDNLFYPDFGLSAKTVNETSVAVKLQRLRAHASDARKKEGTFSLILYGPPGTGKTTLVEAVAKSAQVPLVEITPSDILVGGGEAVERRTRLVFNALSMITNAVILFDEFDSILRDRSLTKDDAPQTVFEFLTPGLLPKLKKLHDSAKEQRVSYVLATNFVFKLDPAAIREGRFDDRHGIYPPDVVSRLGRLLEVVQGWIVQHKQVFDDPKKERLIAAVRATAGAPMDKLGKAGWYTPPGNIAAGTLFHYIINGSKNAPTAQAEAEFNESWETEGPKEGTKDNGYKKYWTDWQTSRVWDKNLESYDEKSGLDWESIIEKVTG